jgi:hypothetical protein
VACNCFLCTRRGSVMYVSERLNEIVVKVYCRSEQLTRILRILGVLLPKTADLESSSRAIEIGNILPTTLNVCSLSRKVSFMRCYHLLWCIKNLIVPVRYHYSNNFEYLFSQWRAKLQEVLPSTLMYPKGESAGEISLIQPLQMAIISMGS